MVYCLPLDLSDKNSVHDFAEEYAKLSSRCVCWTR